MTQRMVTCEKCGSINVARTRSSRLDKIVRFFTGRKRVTCMRCLWTARVKWEQPDDFVQSPQTPRPMDATGNKSET